MMDPREEQRAWLRALLAKTGLTPHALARKAHLSPPTLTVFLNSPEATHALSARTIAALEAASGLRYGPEPRPSGGSREPEAAPFSLRSGTPEADFIRAAIGGRNAVDPWTLKSGAIEGAGYLQGDILIVDLNGSPRPGDVVCAQIYDWARADARTIFRLWQPPAYLQPMTNDPKLQRIFVVDNDTVQVKGVVVATIRLRAGARAA